MIFQLSQLPPRPYTVRFPPRRLNFQVQQWNGVKLKSLELNWNSTKKGVMTISTNQPQYLKEI